MALFLGAAALGFPAPEAQAEPQTVEVEPNDFAGTATSLNLSSRSAVGIGALATGDDVDYFSFIAPPGAKVWILVDTTNVVDGEFADPYLSLIASDGATSLEEDDDDGLGNGCGTTVTNDVASAISGLTLDEGGTYYIRIESFLGPIESYNLFVALTVEDPVPEAEPNDTVANAEPIITLLSPLGLRSGLLDSSSDEDVYQIETLAGNTLLLALDCDPTRAGGLYLAMELLGTDGATVLFSSQLQFPRLPPRNDASRAFCFAVPATGTYYVRVRHGISGTDPAPYHLMVLSRGPGTLLFGESSYLVRENDGSAALEVLRGGGALGEVTVEFATSNGTAVAATDYTSVFQVLTFPEGVTTQYVTVPILNDTLTESNETVLLTLRHPTGGALVGTAGTTELIILDDDEVVDNSPGTATVVVFNSSFAVLDQASGGLPLAISPDGDADWFVFDASAGSLLWTLVDTGGPQGIGANSRDSQLALFAANGTTLIEEDDDDGSGNGGDSTLEPDGELASAIAGRSLTNSGSYFLRVQAAATDQIIVPYQLYVVLTPAPFTQETEANDLPESANILLSGGAAQGVLRGAINTAGDVDYYTITVPSNSLIYVSADCNPEKDDLATDLVLDLFSATDPEPLFEADSDLRDREAAEAFCYRLEAAGTYYLLVRHSSPTGTGTYTLMAARYLSEQPEIQITSIKLSDLDVRIRFTSQNGAHYQIERADALGNPTTWVQLDTVPGNGGIYSYLDVGGGAGGQHYYRVRLLQ